MGKSRSAYMAVVLGGYEMKRYAVVSWLWIHLPPSKLVTRWFLWEATRYAKNNVAL